MTTTINPLYRHWHKSRATIFYESWLQEMPKNIPVGRNVIGVLQQAITQISPYLPPVIVNATTSKIIGTELMYYWNHPPGEQTTIECAVELARTGINARVIAVGKSIGSLYSPAQLYGTIIDDNHCTRLRIRSDDVMSVGGLSIWRTLLRTHNLSYYDLSTGITTMELFPIESESHLLSLFGDSDHFKNYQFVLTNTPTDLAETQALFTSRRNRFNLGYPADSA